MVEVVSRLMSSSVSRLSSLMGCVGMSRCVEVCRGGVEGGVEGCVEGGVEGLSVKLSRHEGVCRGLNSDTVCMTVNDTAVCTYIFLQSYLTGCASSSPPSPSSYC